MGGRGASAPFIPAPLRIAMSEPEPGSMRFVPPAPGTYQYIAITSRELPPGGAHYAFLEGLGREWTIATRDLGSAEEIHPYHSFGMFEPTLRWVKDNKMVDLYVDGMSMEGYFQAAGLRFHNEKKGPYVLSKRVSRIMRPYFVSGEFNPPTCRSAIWTPRTMPP